MKRFWLLLLVLATTSTAPAAYGRKNTRHVRSCPPDYLSWRKQEHATCEVQVVSTGELKPLDLDMEAAPARPPSYSADWYSDCRVSDSEIVCRGLVTGSVEDGTEAGVPIHIHWWLWHVRDDAGYLYTLKLPENPPPGLPADFFAKGKVYNVERAYTRWKKNREPQRVMIFRYGLDTRYSMRVVVLEEGKAGPF
jgi:hypothetical protein